jgi:hypothetical protein
VGLRRRGAAAVALGVHEVVQALRRLGARPPKAPLVVGGAPWWPWRTLAAPTRWSSRSR